MIIQTKDPKSIQPHLKNLFIPSKDSHKGQNGKVLIIGGSKLFHSSPIWSAEVSSHFVDMVHFSSTAENNEILKSLKKQFLNGIVIHKINILDYVKEDDAILIGPGMIRGDIKNQVSESRTFQEIINLEDEADYARQLMFYLITHHPNKRFVIDAGALQMMDASWLKYLIKPAIITPHVLEFERLFEVSIEKSSNLERQKIVSEMASKYRCTILLKSVVDIVSNGEKSYNIEGGNTGLTKGGSGDVLAGLVLSFRAKNDDFDSCIFASFIEKFAAEKLALDYGIWFNTTDLVTEIPKTTHLLFDKILAIKK